MHTTELLLPDAVPAFDAAVQVLLDYMADEPHPDRPVNALVVGIENDQGEVYRTISVFSEPDLVVLCRCLEDEGLSDRLGVGTIPHPLYAALFRKD